MMSHRFPRLCFVGAMVGRNPGYVTTQGMILADHFASLDNSVVSTSAKTNRYIRLLDITKTIVRCRRSIDVQCLEMYSGPSFVVQDVSSWLGKTFGHGLVMVLHGGALPEFMMRYPQWTRRVLSRADALVTPSPFLARAVKQHGFEAIVIPNLIDLSQYPFQQRRKLRPNLLWMRTFHPTWNPGLALRVLARLIPELPHATLVMAGRDGGYESEIRKLAVKLGVASAVRFAGFLDMAGKRRESSEADIFINTNRIDNMPVGIVEACAMGLPIVSTRVGGIPDLLGDGQTGLLVPDDDDTAMVEAIKRLLADSDLSENLSIQGRRLAEKSSWERVRPQWEQVFTEAFRRGTSSRN